MDEQKDRRIDTKGQFTDPPPKLESPKTLTACGIQNNSNAN